MKSPKQIRRRIVEVIWEGELFGVLFILFLLATLPVWIFPWMLYEIGWILFEDDEVKQ